MICNKAQKGRGTLAKVIKPIKLIGATLFCFLFLFGCEEKPIGSYRTDNPAVTVDLLMQHDGCKIYRFTDNGHLHYFVKCADAKVATTDGTIPEGKSSSTETIVTANGK